eukprot:g61879.t1
MAQAEEIRTETGPLDYDYTEKEVELCQENLQNHKACSPDKIKNEMLKYGGTRIVSFLDAIELWGGTQLRASGSKFGNKERRTSNSLTDTELEERKNVLPVPASPLRKQVVEGRPYGPAAAAHAHQASISSHALSLSVEPNERVNVSVLFSSLSLTSRSTELFSKRRKKKDVIVWCAMVRSLNVPTSSCHMLTSCQQTGRLVRQAPTLLSIPLFAATDDNEIQSKSMRCWYRS